MCVFIWIMWVCVFWESMCVFNWIMCVRVRVRARVKFFSCASVMFRNRNVAQESACRAERHAIRASICRWLCAYLR